MKNTITKEKFLAYEKVRLSGKTNMFDVEKVIALSGFVLEKNDCMYIMREYSALARKFLPKNPHAVALGKIKSEKKSEQARLNGKKGGRPKK